MHRALVFLPLTLCMAGIASAQEPPADCPAYTKAMDSEATKLAGTWFGKAQDLVAEQKYEEGLAAFACSYRFVEHPNTLFNMAQTAHLAGRQKLALDLARGYLRKDPYGPMSEEAQALIAKIEKEEKEPKAVPVAMPAKPAGQPVSPTATKGPEPEPSKPAASPDEEHAQDGGSAVDLDVVGYAMIGVGGAAAIAGAVLQGLAVKAKSDAEKSHSYKSFKSLDSDRETYQISAAAGFALAGAAATAGLLLILLGDDEPEKAVSLVVEPEGLGLAGRF
jgi:hypothetical protein